MRLKLTVDVPDSATPDVVLQQLLGCALNQQGISIMTPRLRTFDVDLVEVERVAVPSLVQEVTG